MINQSQRRSERRSKRTLIIDEDTILFSVQGASIELRVSPSRVRDMRKEGILIPICRLKTSANGHFAYVYAEGDIERLKKKRKKANLS